ncbi:MULTISPECIES: efflux RND transporter periplasmic adaptor subunit [unclassified Brevundimonas]|uniref:efflux RND transporter periplasmic adaptor subunit n=1 Tax=unclassified Brevundimonas TaxID=2622653 RepID=UPI003F915AB4
MTATPPLNDPLIQPRRRRWAGKRLALGLLALLLVAVAVWFFFLRGGETTAPYRTEAVQRGDIVTSVSASGTLEALVTVEVGSQISGQVTQVLVDYNDRVKKGQVMAVLDPQNQRSAVDQSRAAIQAAQAQVATAQAQVALAQADYERQKFLFDRGIVAQAVLDTASATLRTANAGVQQARAQVAQQQASLRANQATLGRTTIVAPIDGVVIDRKVEPGQTVASGLNVAVLFTLAQDLSRVQALISVDEADIGAVKVGQTVKFTVDAFPNDNFVGQVTRIRMLPTTASSVVAYTVEAEAENPGEKLLPGMTANAEIIQQQLTNVLRVPNAALRFTPAGMQAPSGQSTGGSPFGVAGGGQQRQGQGPGQAQGGGQGGMAVRIADQLNLDADQKRKIEPILQAAQAATRAGGRTAAAGRNGPSGQRRGPSPATAAAFNKAFDEIKPLLRPDQQTQLETLRGRFAGGGGRGVVWVLVGDKPVQRSVRTGATDGSYTEITDGDLKPGDQVVTGGGPRPTAPSAQAQQQAQRRVGGVGGIGGGGGGPPR